MVCRVIRAKEADIRRVWLDNELTLDQASVVLGMSKDSLRDRAVRLGLPPRKGGSRCVIRRKAEPEFRLMWKAGVSARVIGARFGCSYFAVVNTAARLGLEMRGAGYRPKLTFDQYRERKLAAAMSLAAAKERPLWKEATQ